MKRPTFNKTWINLFLGTLLLSWVTIYNGFPLIYNDTATYIKSGMLLDTPADRPITYGLFILLTSLHSFSLFLTVFFQNLILSWLLLECLIKCLGKSALRFFLAILLPLAFLSGLCWVSNQIIADLFTSFIFLSAFLILTYDKAKKTQLGLLYLLFFLAVGSHLSHISITQIVLCAYLPFAIRLIPLSLPIPKTAIRKRGAALIVLGLSAILLMGAAISKSSPIFFTGKLCENGLLKKFLDEKCATTDYKLCAYKAELTYSAVDFIWNTKAATSKLGGWDAAREEYSTIDRAILGNPKYLKQLLSESIKSSLQQFSLNNIGEGNTRLRNDSNNAGTLAKYFPNEASLFTASVQNSEKGIDFRLFNRVYTICYLISALVFLILFFRKIILRQFNLLFLLALMVITGITANNIISASLANAVNRFGLRVIWLLVFVTILMLAELLRSRIRKQAGTPAKFRIIPSASNQ
jgi:hypothetical protein